MDREQFGKIRNATRSIAAQKADALDLQSPNKGLVHDAIDYLKLLRDMGGHEGKDYVEAHSDLWQERQKIGKNAGKPLPIFQKRNGTSKCRDSVQSLIISLGLPPMRWMHQCALETLYIWQYLKRQRLRWRIRAWVRFFVEKRKKSSSRWYGVLTPERRSLRRICYENSRRCMGFGRRVTIKEKILLPTATILRISFHSCLRV